MRVGYLYLKINGRISRVKSKNQYTDVNVLGMDYIMNNYVEFKMNVNRFHPYKSMLTFKFDAF